MPTLDVVRAWKDEEYRTSLPEDVQAALPKAPDNMGELSDDELVLAAGGWSIGDVLPDWNVTPSSGVGPPSS
jgi:mersacidin/lichenicidin family type 2 lantibiotic